MAGIDPKQTIRDYIGNVFAALLMLVFFIAAGRAGPHGDCGLRDRIVYRKPVANSVQPFYLGAFYVFGILGLFNFRFFLAETD